MTRDPLATAARELLANLDTADQWKYEDALREALALRRQP